ncbi:MAG: hypothetical protein FWE71_15850 [Nocardioidaceae bacterium]|nr:hypothetical protein [Nocardioidaceae bacterium]MCL2614367.1 hypothetical protein [Nocardioidaceae bacterium]
MTNRAPLTDRRGALRAAAAAALTLPVLAACDATVSTPPRSGRERRTGRSSGGDQALVASLARQIAGTRAAATVVAHHHHDSRNWALGLATLHQKHLHRLGATSARPAVVSARTPTALVSAERRLQHSLVAGAGQAESGALAQVLASMAAAIGQRLVNA